MNNPVNQLIESPSQAKINFKKIPDNMEWSIKGYLYGGSVRKCPKKFEEFHSLQFICQSGDYFHFLGNTNKILVCTLKFKK